MNSGNLAAFGAGGGWRASSENSECPEMAKEGALNRHKFSSIRQ
jgi:hypothetical protein